MNISNKLVTIAENQEKVYKAGQSSMVDESKIIEKTVSGEYISVDDVSEIPHEVKIKLTSGGKNLWEWFDLLSVQGDGKSYTLLESKKIDPVEKLTFSCYAEISDITFSASGNLIFLTSYHADGTSKYHSIVQTSNLASRYISITIDGIASPIVAVAMTQHNRWTGGTIKLTDIMLEENDTATEYEPYKETLTDYSGVSLTRCGGNLIKFNYKDITMDGISIVNNNDRTITANGTATSLFQLISRQMPCITNETYISFSLGDVSQSGVKGQIVLYGENDAILYNRYFSSAETRKIPKGCKSIELNLYIVQGTTVENFVFKPMVNFGSTPLPYEPYNGQTLTANADGTVEGVKSTSPYMYMTTDNANCTINATYHKSYGMQTEYDRFWDRYQDYGKRAVSEALFAGSGWNDDVFNPKYDIVPTNSQSMFWASKITDLVSGLKKAGVTLDWSLCKNITTCFAYSQVTHIGEILLSENNITNTNNAFYYATKLHTIDKIKVYSNMTFNNTFNYCSALENITFEGTIGNTIDFQWSTKLSKASILNIFSVLSSTETGKTLTLSKTAATNAFGSTTATEWTNLVATKTNWTISLV